MERRVSDVIEDPIELRGVLFEPFERAGTRRARRPEIRSVVGLDPSFDALTHAKSILISPPNVAIEHLFPPYTKEKVEALSQWTEY